MIAGRHPYKHLKLSPPPGFQGGVEDAEISRLPYTFVLHQEGLLLQLLGDNQRPKGRLNFEDLMLFGTAQERKQAMDIESSIDAEISGDVTYKNPLETADYFSFEVGDDRLWSVAKGPISSREGVFRITEKGLVVLKAVRYLIEELSYTRDEVARDALFDSLDSIEERHPNNPYIPALRLEAMFQNDQPLDAEFAEYAFSGFKRSRKQFESLMPKGFSGTIEPNLVGNGAENFQYFSCLYYGALSASALENQKTAEAWARRSLRHHKDDSFGARFILGSTQS